MFGISFIDLYIVILGSSILCTGLFGHLAMKSKSYEEEMKWERMLVISSSVCLVAIGLGLLSLIFIR